MIESATSRVYCQREDYQKHNRNFGDDTKCKYEVLAILYLSADTFDYKERPLRIKCNGEIIYYETGADKIFFNAIKENRKHACLCYNEDETDFFREKYFEVMI